MGYELYWLLFLKYIHKHALAFLLFVTLVLLFLSHMALKLWLNHIAEQIMSLPFGPLLLGFRMMEVFQWDC